MDIAKSRIMEVGLVGKIVNRAVQQVSKAGPARTEKIVVNELCKAVKNHKESK